MHAKKSTCILCRFHFLKSVGLLLFILIYLSGCASSNVQREAASGVDLGVQNAKNLSDSVSNGDITNSYQNSSQATKGGIIGGTIGAVTGAMSSGIGVVAGAATGTILGASYGSYIDMNTTLSDQLINRGANVIELGDERLIVLPSTIIFNAMTATIKPSAYSTLDLLAQYLNTYTTTLVTIAAYTNESGSERINLALSNQQAQSLVKYFSANGVNTRILYGIGYGGTRLVSKNSGDWSESLNYRIEISFKRVETNEVL